ncbi:Bifunctional ligase/repressor BirA [Marinomonas gallaica]|uniref:Bifunctional ligase/repressor BirA n=1 Tax=Marinomonas gallaica TaxID=1806667 RepID=A0A1C3JS36_9GAMM|nr:YafY family protein [Marinomonas gallaica]SBT17926.1 Bifunctional ligase/repressor BirA [Marinomonas gallaica]SBT20774.1 Bifunctional ligase/repressor BirA [Marinomonas gallaica]
MRKSDRLFQLTNILRKHQPVTAKTLAEKLGVSERTIYRYMDDLSVSGVPVYGEAGVGYSLSEGYELPPLTLTAQELEALVSGVNFVAALTTDSFSQSAQSLLAKIEAALPEHISQTDDKRIVRTPVLAAREENRSIWGRLHTTIQSQGQITLQYQSANESVTQRAIYPLGLFYWGGKWTLGAWCFKRHAYRDFRIDRIQAMLPAEQQPIPSNVSLSHYINLRQGESY